VSKFTLLILSLISWPVARFYFQLLLSLLTSALTFSSAFRFIFSCIGREACYSPCHRPSSSALAFYVLFTHLLRPKLLLSDFNCAYSVFAIVLYIFISSMLKLIIVISRQKPIVLLIKLCSLVITVFGSFAVSPSSHC
jgi:hypothetical protein